MIGHLTRPRSPAAGRAGSLIGQALAVALLAALLVLPGVALAEERDWSAEAPKGMSGGIVCRGEASHGGNTYRQTNYIGADAAREGTDAERAWQVATCDRYAREDVARAFRFIWGQEIDPASVRVSWEPYRE